MRQVAGLLVVAVGLIACGGDDGGGDDDAAVPPQLTSGTRIKITWFEFLDGSRQPMWLVDSARDNGQCERRRWADGLVRCTPPADTLRPATEFADAACTDGVLRNVIGRHGVELVDVGGEPAIATLREVEQVSLTQLWSRDAGGACVGPTFDPGTFGRPGAEVLADALVVIDRVVPATAGRITVAVDTTADGLYFPTHARDTELGFDCVLAPSAPDAVSCLPNRYTIAYRDAGCTQAVAQRPLDEDLPRFIGSDRGCEHRLYEAGPASSEGARFWLGIDGVCEPFTTPNERWFELTPREAAVMERSRFVTAGRRLAAIAMTSGEHGLPDPWWYDEELGDECTLGFAGIAQVCRPQVTGVVRPHFADAACTQALDLAVVSAGLRPCNLDPAPTFTVGVDGIRRVGPRHVGPAWRRDPQSGTCVDTPHPDVQPGSDLYTLGERLAEERFLGGTYVVD